MPSQALHIWLTESAQRLDELLDAHAGVSGLARGRRRYTAAQINAALVVQLAAHFQLFCRNLHSEAAEFLVLTAPAGYGPMLLQALTERRSLDRGNATVQAIGKDFDRFNFDIWKAAAMLSSETVIRRQRLDQVMAWRNAIAHQDFSFSDAQRLLLHGTTLTLAWVRRWRSACDRLARTFDRVADEHVRGVTGGSPW